MVAEERQPGLCVFEKQHKAKGARRRSIWVWEIGSEWPSLRVLGDVTSNSQRVSFLPFGAGLDEDFLLPMMLGVGVWYEG